MVIWLIVFLENLWQAQCIAQTVTELLTIFHLLACMVNALIWMVLQVIVFEEKTLIVWQGMFWMAYYITGTDFND